MNKKFGMNIYGLGSALAMLAMGAYAGAPLQQSEEMARERPKGRPAKKRRVLVKRDTDVDHAAHIHRAEAKRLRKAQKLKDRGHL